jgi:hypothetical protein
LIQNFYAAQIEPDGMPADERSKIEEQAAKIKADSNYFQMEKVGLTSPANLLLSDNKITWNTAFAGDFPISHYEVMIGGQLAGKVEHKPQVLKSRPFIFETDKAGTGVAVVAVDKAGNRAEAVLV